MSILLWDVWNVSWLGNTVRDYMVALAVFVGALVVLKLVQRFATARVAGVVAKTATNVDNAILRVVQTIRPPFYWFLAFYGAIQWLTLRGELEKFIDTVLLVWVVFQVVIALQIFFEYFVKARFVRKEDRATEVVSNILAAIIKIVLWITGILFILQNLGVNVTSLIAGLGIGGLALALAAQKILEDLFASLAIYFDRPFEPGDFVAVKDVKGTVKKVGIKTTRLKALSGEEIILPNKDISSSMVKNYKRMKHRRVSFTLGVTYDTPDEKMGRVAEIIKRIISAIPQIEFKRVTFVEFGGSALIFEVIYHVETREYDVYATIHEQVLLAIKKEFAAAGIQMAYPTRTVYTRS